jgi:hypothetical protein
MLLVHDGGTLPRRMIMAEACTLFIALLAVAPVSGLSQPTGPAFPVGSPALNFSTQATIEGKLAHWLGSPYGDIDGVVLDDGAVALFSPGQHVASLPVRKGEQVRVRGDVVGGFPGPILLRASVEQEPGLFSGIALRPPQGWPNGLPALSFTDELMWVRVGYPATGSLPSPGTGKWSYDVVSARHPRLQQRTPVTRVARWLKRLTSGGSQESDARFNRREEDDGP